MEKRKTVPILRFAFLVALILSCALTSCQKLSAIGSISITGKPANNTVDISKGNVSLKLSSSSKQVSTYSVKWESSDSSVAEINSSGTIDLKAAGTVTISAAVIGNESVKDSFPLTVTDNSVAAVSIIKSPVTSISITGKPNDNTVQKSAKNFKLSYTYLSNNKDSFNVVWSSSNSSVATVDSTGLVSINDFGVTTIKVKVQNSTIEDTFDLTVTGENVKSVEIAGLPDSKKVIVGKTITLSSTYSPEDCLAYNSIWTSSDTTNKIATIGQSTGVFKAISPGTVKIKMTVSGTDITNSVTIQVVAAPPVNTEDFEFATVTGTTGSGNMDFSCEYGGVTMQTTSIKSEIPENGSGTAAKITATKAAWGGIVFKVKNLTKGVNYALSFDVKTLASDGDYSYNVNYGNTFLSSFILGVGNSYHYTQDFVATGPSSTIKLYIASTSATSSFSIDNFRIDQPQSVTITNLPNINTLVVGSTWTVGKAVSGGLTGTAEWSSSDTSVATIDKSTGAITAVSAGTATTPASTTISVVMGGYVNRFQLYVTVPTVYATSLPSNDTVIMGSIVQLGVEVFSKVIGTTTWYSSDTSIATIDASTGKITALSKAGTTNITVTNGNLSSTFVLTVNPPSVSIVNYLNGGTVVKGNNTTLNLNVSNIGLVTGTAVWTSSNPNVAKIDTNTGYLNQVLVTGMSVGTCVISVKYGTLNASFSITIDPPSIMITDKPGGNALAVATSAALTFDTSKLGQVTGKAVWKSSNTLAATIDPSTGVVRGNMVGTTTITLTYGSVTDSFTLIIVSSKPKQPNNCENFDFSSVTGVNGTDDTGTVTFAPTSNVVLSLTNDANELPTNGSGYAAKLVASGADWGGIQFNYANLVSDATYTMDFDIKFLSGVDASSKPYTYYVDYGSTSLGSFQSTIGGSYHFSGTFTGGSASSIKVFISAGAPVSPSGTGSFTIDNVNVVEQLTITSKPTGNLMIIGGNTVALGVIVPDVLTGSATWASSNTSVATINPTTGVVTAKTPGTSTITLSYGGKTDSFTLTVQPPSVSIGSKPTSNILVTGVSSTLTLDTTKIGPVTGTTVWTSSNTGVATIDSKTGKVSAMVAGTTTITATYGSLSDSFTLTVVNPSITITGLPGNNTLLIKSSASLTLDLTKIGLLTGTAAWSSSNASVATIDPVSGYVTAIAVGSTTITVHYGSLTDSFILSAVTQIPKQAANCENFDYATVSGTSGKDDTGNMAFTADTNATLSITKNSSELPLIDVNDSINAALKVTVNGTDWGGMTLSNLTGLVTGATYTVSFDIKDIDGGNPYYVNYGSASIGNTSFTPGLGKSYHFTQTFIGGAATAIKIFIGTKAAIGTFTIDNFSVVGIGITNQPNSMLKGSTVTLGSVISGAITGNTVWTSSAPSVATINPSTGVLNAVDDGTSTVTVTCGSYSSSFTLTVAVPSVVIVGKPENDCLFINDSAITLGATPLGGVTGTAAWSSSNSAVAKIDPSTGLLTPVAVGKATISVAYGGKTDSFVLTVNPPAPPQAANCENFDYATVSGTSGKDGTGNLAFTADTNVTLSITKNSSELPLIDVNDSLNAALKVTVNGTDWGGITLSNLTGLVTGATYTVSFDIKDIDGGNPYYVNYGTTSIGNTSFTPGLGKSYHFTQTFIGGTATTIKIFIGTKAAIGTFTIDNFRVEDAQHVTPTASITNKPVSFKLEVGSSATLGSTITGSVTTAAVWSSSAPSVASIDSATGVVTANSVGTTVITVAYGTYIDSFVLTVVVPTPHQPVNSEDFENAIISGVNGSDPTSNVTFAPSTNSVGTGTLTLTNDVNQVPTTGSGNALEFTGVGTYYGGVNFTLGGLVPGTVYTVSFDTKFVSGTDDMDVVYSGGASNTNVDLKSVPQASGASQHVTKTFTATDATTIKIFSLNSSAIDTFTIDNFSVVAQQGVTITGKPTNSTMAVGGGTITLGATASGGLTGSALWSSSAPSVATVDSSTGVVTAISAGTTTITVTYGAKTDSFLLTVTMPTVTITGKPTNNSMIVGSTITLGTTVTGGLTGSASWSSDTQSVATVDPVTGIVTAVSAGTTTITVTFGGKTDSFMLTVTLPSVTITGKPIANTMLSNASPITLGTTVTGGITNTPVWSSSVSGVATIDPVTGLLTPIAAGSTVITVKCGIYTDNFTLIVTAQIPPQALNSENFDYATVSANNKTGISNGNVTFAADNGGSSNGTVAISMTSDPNELPINGSGQAVKFTGTSSYYGGIQFGNLTLVAAQTYTVSFDVKFISGTDNLTVNYGNGLTASGGANFGTIYKSNGVTQHITITNLTATSYNYLKIFALSGSATDSFTIDNFSVVAN